MKSESRNHNLSSIPNPTKEGTNPGGLGGGSPPKLKSDIGS